MMLTYLSTVKKPGFGNSTYYLTSCECGREKVISKGHFDAGQKRCGLCLGEWWNKKRIDKKTGCWLWDGAKSSNGYGIVTVNGEAKGIHRLSFEKYKNAIPKGLCVLHSCDIVNCFNPNHLRTGTHKDNMKDKTQRNRQAKGEKSGHSKLTESQVRYVKKGLSSVSYLAKMFNVNKTTIYKILNGKTWGHI